MFLYSLTLQKSTAITQAVYGNFSGPKSHEIVAARGKVLELLRPDEQGKVQTVCSTEVFGEIRSIVQFRLTGGSKDYVAVGSDSGRLVVLEFSEASGGFERVHQETFGKSGCRRIVPGQHLAVDPKGRALMIGALEKQKLVYVLNRDASARLTISSPLEAHKAHHLCFHIIGLEVGFDNPIFAAIEMDYSDADADPTAAAVEEATKELVFYELDLGLNHVVRKWADPIDATSNFLIAVPGGADGPGGVVVCSENWLCYRNKGHEELRVPLPRRAGMPAERGTLIVSSSTHRQKGGEFFMLAQTEYGDLYKITLEFDGETVSVVSVQLFDTIPTCHSISIMRPGFLFAAAETGDHTLYQFSGLGDEESGITCLSSMDLENLGEEDVVFKPRPSRNLVTLDQLPSIAPVIDCAIADLAREQSPQIYTLCGRSSRGSLRTMRHGLAIEEMAIQELPANPNGLWTVRSSGEALDRYIVVSFPDATLVLSIGDTVEEVEPAVSGFLGDKPTLLACSLGDDSFCQVHPNGIRTIRADGRTEEWTTPGKKHIVACAANNRQVAVALSGGDLLCFELDSHSGSLQELQRKDMGHEVSCIGIGPVPHGRQRQPYLAVGDSSDPTVRILSLDPDDDLSSVAVQALPSAPTSLSMATMGGDEVDSDELYLHVGLSNGVLLRTAVDVSNGSLQDTRTRFLGTRAVSLTNIDVRGQPAVLALSSRSWLCYDYQQKFTMTPLSYEQLDHVASFKSDSCPDGLVAVSGNTLRVIAVERLGQQFNQAVLPLSYTPRQLCVIAGTRLVIVEAEHAVAGAGVAQPPGELVEVKTAEMADDDDAEDEDEDEDDEPWDSSVFGPQRSDAGTWASCIRVVDAVGTTTVQQIELADNEAAFCVAACTFAERPGESFVAVGTVTGLVLQPRSMSAAAIHLYRVTEASELELVHKTNVDGVPSCFCAFQGRLLAGVGGVLRIYDLGKKQLLRKCECKGLPNSLVKITTQGDRIYVADVGESMHFIKYKRDVNQLSIFADDTSPRWMTAAAMLDFDTMAGADKFGNLFVARLPPGVSDEIESYGPSQALVGANNKLDTIAQFHVGEMCHTLDRVALQPGGVESLVYTTTLGGLGALIPFSSREDVDFFQHLEMHVRQESTPLCGRDHLAYRSAYYPVKDVIDGDLVEMFTRLPKVKQTEIAQELDRSTAEVVRKLEDMRSKCI